MKNFMKKFVGKSKNERHYFVIEDADFMEVMCVINDQFIIDQFQNGNITIGRIGQKKWNDLSSKQMYIHFSVSESKWVKIVAELGRRGFVMDIYSNDPENVHLTKQVES